MNDNAAAMAEAEQARAALDRWLGPAFAVVEKAYADRIVQLAATEPWSDKKITKVAMALKVAQEVRSQIEAVVANGDVARHNADHARKIEDIPTQKRLWGVG